MKRTTLLISFLILTTPALIAQSRVFSFKDMTEHQKADVEELEKLHCDAFEIFSDKKDSVMVQWQNLHLAVADFLTKKNFRWDNEGKLFLRFYFEPDGDIHKLGYNPKNSLSKKELEKFETLMNEFTENFNFGLVADKSYVQCGSVTYQNK